MPDPIFEHPRLAQIYDVFDSDRSDLVAYLSMVREFGARTVLDLGCGTGSFAKLLVENGIAVIGVDPAAASLDVAKAKIDSKQASWICGDAISVPADSADVAVMTGNVAQVFLTGSEWLACLQNTRRAIRDSGYLIFESRRPEAKAWEDWAIDVGPVVHDVVGLGRVEQRREVTDVNLPFVSFRYTYAFDEGRSAITSDSTLRFRTLNELEVSLVHSGYSVIDVRDAPDRPGKEYVVIARRNGETGTSR